MTWPTPHLTADDLDAFHSASLSAEATEHLQTCAECRTLVEQDRALVAALEALPSLEPSYGFAERVLARVSQPLPLPVPIRRRGRLALAASVLVALGASIGWSVLNRALLLSWIDTAAAQAGRLLWEGVATVAQNLSEQPWLSALRDFGSSTGRLALAGAVLVAGYVAAMIALRRLLLLPLPLSLPPAIDANR